MRSQSIVLLLIACLLMPLPGMAAKKSKGPSDEEVKQTLTPMIQTMDKLSLKVQSRAFFTHKDSATMAELRGKLLEAMDTYPNHPLLARPVLQAALLFQARDQFADAIELFQFLSTQYPQLTVATRARIELSGLKRQLGPHYFPEEVITETPDTQKKANKT